jgi:nucleotide-binding universal stress UspA family protein
VSEILVGVDGTPGSEDALAFAHRLASSTGARLCVATAYPYSDMHTRASNEAFRSALREDALAMLDRAAAGLGEQVRTQAVADVSPARALHGLAEDIHAALVVVGSTHRGRVGRVMPGSTAERLLHGSPCPVAIVPRGYASHDREIRTIGVGYDGFEESEAALASACELARGLRARVRVITVFDATPDATPGLVPGVEPAAVQAGVEAIEREQLTRRVNELAVEAEAEAVFVAGTPGPTLAAEAGAVDVLVMGSRGYGPPRAVLLGGVSHALVREASRPVVVLPRSAEVGLEALCEPSAEASA